MRRSDNWVNLSLPSAARRLAVAIEMPRRTHHSLFQAVDGRGEIAIGENNGL
jgi:hypothetical protein